MSLAHMKTLPKALLGIAVLSAAGYGLTFIKLPAKAPSAEVVEPVSAAPAASTAIVVAPAPAGAPVAHVQDVPTGNVTSGDAGMAALLKAGKK